MKMNDLLIEISRLGEKLSVSSVLTLLSGLDLESFKADRFCLTHKSRGTKNLLTNTENFMLYTCFVPKAGTIELISTCSNELIVFVAKNSLNRIEEKENKVFNEGQFFETTMHGNTSLKNETFENSVAICVGIKKTGNSKGEVNDLCEKFDSINGMVIS